VNPGDHLGIWLALVTGSAALAAWNISRLRIVRPALDRLVAWIGSAAILMLVVGASLVITEVTECTFAASSLACSKTEILLVALLDLVASAALITRWLRADACRASGVRPARRPARSS
jgi:fucose 4-O-acetylase-like acetyltransferase